METIKKYLFTENQINLDSLKRNFDFEHTYTTSSKDVQIWLNISDIKNYATLGYQKNHHGFISHISKDEAINLLNNI